MRVAMLSKACLMGPYQRKLVELAGLMREGKLTVLVPACWRDERGPVELERAYTEGYELRVTPLALNGHFHLHYYPGLYDVLRELCPDIVHIDEEPYNLATFLALHAARRVGARTLFFGWQNILRRYPPPFGWMERYVLARADYALAGSSEAQTVLRAKGYTGRARVIPQFGVDPEVFRPAAPVLSPAEGSEQTYVVGYSGRLVREKGVDLLLEATARLDGVWKLCIMGDGPERDNLVALAVRLGIADRVIFRGLIAPSRMPEIYPSLHTLVLPSRTSSSWKEQFGRVLIEAMACGVPVVGSDAGEIPQVIGDAGLLFPEGDVDGLHSALALLQTDGALRQDLARRGRSRVLNCYTQRQVARATYEVYREMMAGED